MPTSIEAGHGAVGLHVRMIRETLGLDQATIASRIGLERSNLTNIEAGRQRLQLQTVEKLARALGVSPKHLLKGVWW
jgi:transcriptional regulator with XRE-family HTH domain